MSNTTASVGQTLGQLGTLAVSSSRAAGRPSGSVNSIQGSSSRAQGAQRTQHT